MHTSDSMNNFKLAKNYFIIGAKNVLEYKMYWISEMFSDLIYVIITYIAWAYIFSLGYNTIGGFTKIDFLLYFILNLLIVCFYARVGLTFSDDVNSGNLVSLLTKGINPFIKYYFYTVGQAIWEISILIIMLLIGTIISGKFAIINIGLFILFLIFAILLETIIMALIGLFAIKTKRINGIVNLTYMIVGILSGAWVPLNIFPQIYQTISYYLPFQYTRYFPASIFLGKPTNIQISIGIISCVIWIIIFYTIFKLAYKKALKIYESQGG